MFIIFAFACCFCLSFISSCFNEQVSGLDSVRVFGRLLLFLILSLFTRRVKLLLSRVKSILKLRPLKIAHIYSALFSLFAHVESVLSAIISILYQHDKPYGTFSRPWNWAASMKSACLFIVRSSYSMFSMCYNYMSII